MGDYGTVNSKTGQFEKEGNIYEDEATADIACHHPPQKGTPEEYFMVSSTNVKRGEVKTGVEL